MARRHSEENVELNVTAMLDMAFQLLAFFVLTFKPPAGERQIYLRLPPPQVINGLGGQKAGADENQDASKVKPTTTLEVDLVDAGPGAIPTAIVGVRTVGMEKPIDREFVVRQFREMSGSEKEEVEKDAAAKKLGLTRKDLERYVRDKEAGTLKEAVARKIDYTFEHLTEDDRYRAVFYRTLDKQLGKYFKAKDAGDAGGQKGTGAGSFEQVVIAPDPNLQWDEVMQVMDRCTQFTAGKDAQGRDLLPEVSFSPLRPMLRTPRTNFKNGLAGIYAAGIEGSPGTSSPWHARGANIKHGAHAGRHGSGLRAISSATQRRGRADRWGR